FTWETTEPARLRPVPVCRYEYVEVRPVRTVVKVAPGAIVAALSSGRDEVIPWGTESPFANASVSPQFAVTVRGVGPVAPSVTDVEPGVLASATPATASAPPSPPPPASRRESRRRAPVICRR